MWDLRKCFELVQHGRLVQEAYHAGYPMDLLRVSMASYSWPRTLLTDSGVAAPALCPTRGIVAGSAFATYELTAYLIAAMRALVGEFPQASISLHVDDLSYDVTADDRRSAVRQAVALGQRAIQLVQTELGLPFAPEKAATLATTRAAQRDFLSGMGFEPTGAVTQACRLGGDHTLQR